MGPLWRGTRFGLGLLEIGRKWGHMAAPIPSDGEAVAFLRSAFAAGVRVMDTAPSYAHSERRVGLFLAGLAQPGRASLTVATKFGEDWDFEHDSPIVDHSYDALMRSLDRSLKLLGQFEILQVHKATAAVLRDPGVRRAAEEALRRGVLRCGASVKDAEAAAVALEDPLWQQIQVPFHVESKSLAEVIEAARNAGKIVFTNRPYAEGRLLAAGKSPLDCIRPIVNLGFDGAILFGTRSPEHLRSNLDAFHTATM